MGFDVRYASEWVNRKKWAATIIEREMRRAKSLSKLPRFFDGHPEPTIEWNHAPVISHSSS